MRSLTPFVLIAVLLVAPMAASQVPPLPGAPTPVYRVSIANAPPALMGLDVPNASVSAPFDVVLVLANVVCPPGGEVIPVTVTAVATGAPSNFAVVVEPSVINFTIDQGPHAEAAGAAGGTGNSAVRGTLTGNITTNASVAIVLTATAPAPTACQGAGSISAATSEPATVFANMTAPPPPPPEPTPEEDTPFLGALAIATVGALVALSRRRRV